MESLLPAFLAACLAEIGDKTQILALLLAVRFRAPGTVFAGVALAALANSLIGAAGGVLVHALINFRAATLLMAIALVFAGIGALLRQRDPEVASYGRIGAFLTCFLGFLILEFGDKTQFLTMALAARSDSLWLTAAGATAGIAAANAPAIWIGRRWRTILPLRAVRIGVGVLLLFLGTIAALTALRLI